MGDKTGYALYYEDYVSNWITPEYGFWRKINDEPDLAKDDFLELEDLTYKSLTINQLYAGTIFQDVLLGLKKMPETLPDFDKYLRFVSINFGLSGLLTVHTPREVIDGYDDPLIQQLNSMPIYEGGDSTTSPTLSMANPPTHPPNNTVAFFTGEDDYEMTRVYG